MRSCCRRVKETVNLVDFEKKKKVGGRKENGVLTVKRMKKYTEREAIFVEISF